MIAGLALTIFVNGAAAAAQVPGAGTTAPSTDENIISVGEQLELRHVALTTESLIAALKNPDAVVRALAAGKLREDSMVDGNDLKGAIPALAAALAAEKEPDAKIHMATALAGLGDVRGSTVLAHMCYDRDLGNRVRLEAADFLLSVGSQECHDAVVSIAMLGEPIEKAGAFNVLQRFRQLSPRKRVSDVEIMCRGLTDANVNVREAAGNALGFFGEQSAIQCLRDAITHEPKDYVRLVMQGSIDRLESEAKRPRK